jgi:hypothetical protein
MLQAISRVRHDLARTLGRDSVTHAEFVRGFLKYCVRDGSLSPYLRDSIFLQILEPYLPDLSGVNIDEVFALIDTEKKLGRLLLKLPDLSPEELDRFLLFTKTRLPLLREIMLPRVKALPHYPGGAPRKLSSPEEKQKIVEEIKNLRGPGTKLDVIYARIAQRHDVSASKIKQIWYNSPKESR